MNNILNAQEAFAAIHNGKTVLCRFAGNGTLPADKDFSTLDQMPAMVFVWPDYEFCIQVEMMELANIEFTKPLTAQDVVGGQEIYIVMPTKILRTKYDPDHVDIHFAICNGFAQADAENASLQLQAIGAIFGASISHISVVDGFSEIPKRKQRGRKNDQNSTSNEVEALAPPESEQVQDNKSDNTDLDSILGSAGGSIPQSSYTEIVDQVEIETKPKSVVPEVIFTGLMDNIKNAGTESDVLIYRRAIRTNDSLTDDQCNQLEAACEARLTDLVLDEFDATPQVETVQTFTSGTEVIQSATQVDLSTYEVQLKNLLDLASNAKTPTEANALIRYARDWTPEQIEPLKKAIHARLLQLDKPLTTRIREAQSLAILNTFLTDVKALTDPVFAHECMKAFEQRKNQLQNPEIQTIPDSEVPF